MTNGNPLANLQANPQAMMAEVSKHWFSAYKTGLDMLLAISNSALAGAEHMRMMQLATDIEAQSKNRDAAGAMANARDMQGVVKAQQALSQSYLDSFMKYWSTTAQMLQQTQAEMAKVVSAHMGDFGKGFEQLVPGMLNAVQPGQLPQLPGGFNTAIDAMRKSQEAMMKAMMGFSANAASAAAAVTEPKQAGK